MAGLRAGSTEITSVYVGSTEVTSVYAGSTEVWTSGPRVSYNVVKDASGNFTADFTGLGVEAGDTLLIIVARGSVTTNPTFSGWTTTTNESGAFPSANLFILRKTAVGSETTITSTGAAGSQNLVFCVCIKGAPYFSNGGGSFQTGAANPANPPPVSTVSGDYVFVVGVVGITSLVTMTAPAGYTLIHADSYEGTTYDANLAIAWAGPFGTGTEDPGVFGGVSTNSWCAESIVLRPV